MNVHRQADAERLSGPVAALSELLTNVFGVRSMLQLSGPQHVPPQLLLVE